MARMGLRAETTRLFEAIYASSRATDLNRLPELFCGFPRRPRQGPTSYPVACTPQAWAAASLPAFVQACLGLSFDPAARAVRFDSPHLPAFLDNLTLHNLSVRGASVSVVGRDGPGHVQVVTTT